jgi:hypothetical protein
LPECGLRVVRETDQWFVRHVHAIELWLGKGIADSETAAAGIVADNADAGSRRVLPGQCSKG